MKSRCARHHSKLIISETEGKTSRCARHYCRSAGTILTYTPHHITPSVRTQRRLSPDTMLTEYSFSIETTAAHTYTYDRIGGSKPPANRAKSNIGSTTPKGQ